MGNKMNEELLDLFNKYINQEFYTSYLYYAMSTYFDEIMMKGFSMYMKHRASFELEIAQKMYDYLILRDEKLSFLKIDEPALDWLDVSDIFANMLSNEQSLSQEIKKLYFNAKNFDDIGAMEFISQILSEKTKTLSTVRKIVFRIKNSNVIPVGVELMDSYINKC